MRRHAIIETNVDLISTGTSWNLNQNTTISIVASPFAITAILSRPQCYAFEWSSARTGAVSGTRDIPDWTFPIVQKFDRRLGSGAAEMTVKSQSNVVNIASNLATSNFAVWRPCALWIGAPITIIRRSNDRLIFMTGIPLSEKIVLHWNRALASVHIHGQVDSHDHCIRD